MRRTGRLPFRRSFGKIVCRSKLAYNGTKGTDLDVLQLPNRAPLGTPQLAVQKSLLIPNTRRIHLRQFGRQLDLQRAAGAVHAAIRARHFVQHLLYTFSKAIDDSSTLGGGPVLIPERHQRGAGSFAYRPAAQSARELQLPVADQQHADRDQWRLCCAAGRLAAS